MRSLRRKKRAKLPLKHSNCSPAAKSNDAARRFRPPRLLRAPAGTIGIAGGIFDPVHNGHLAVGALARDYFGLSKILFIPSGLPPHKAHVIASAADRLAMLCLAVRGEPSFTVWDGELRRKGVSYTVDTLRKLAQDFPGRHFYFIVGSDNLQEIKTWRRCRDVLAMVTLCVAHRPGYPVKVPRSLAGASIRTFPSPEWGVSATMIREYLARGYSCRHLLPDAVEEYISRRKLYA